jgi:hypothetical protein
VHQLFICSLSIFAAAAIERPSKCLFILMQQDDDDDENLTEGNPTTTPTTTPMNERRKDECLLRFEHLLAMRNRTHS